MLKNLYHYYAGTTTTVEPWGQDSLRVKEIVGGVFIYEDFSLTEKVINKTLVIKHGQPQEVVSNMPVLRRLVLNVVLSPMAKSLLPFKLMENCFFKL